MRREKNRKDRIVEYEYFFNDDSSIYFSERQRRRERGRMFQEKREEEKQRSREKMRISTKTWQRSKKRCHHLNSISVNTSRGSYWYKIKKDGLKKIKLDINHPEQEIIVGKLN